MLIENSFEKIAGEWLHLKKMSVKHSTYIKYKNIIRLYLNDFFLDKNINDYDQSYYYECFNSLVEHNNLSSSTLKSIRFILRGILSYGEENYNLKHVNFSYLKISSAKHNITVLTKNETYLLSQYCQSHINDTTVAVYLSMYTGMRLGEICGLKWKDIDLDKGLITVLRTVQRIEDDINESSKTSKMIFEPKTESSKRIIVMTDFLIEYLKMYQGMIHYEPSYYLITNSMSIPEPRNIQRKFKTICTHLGIYVNFHNLRHSFATNCISCGIDVKTLSELLGHSNISTTMNLYVHPTIEYKREQINKIPK